MRQNTPGRATIAGGRLLAARRQQLEQARARVDERLAQAEAKLEALGWRGRRKLRSQLRAEIAREQAALRLANEQLAQPLPELKPQRVPAERDAIELARQRSPQRRPARAPIQRSPALQRERGHGIGL